MTINLHSPKLNGRVKAIASKSEVHRLLICAALADNATSIACSEINADIEATQKCLSALGAQITYENGFFYVKPIREIPVDEVTLLPGESGSTLRFLLPIVCGLGVNAKFIMEGRLADRPLSPLKELLEENGATIHKDNNVLYVSGKVNADKFTIAGDISSQFISGLLFMLPMWGGEVEITGKTQSLPYIEMTIAALAEFGCEVIKTPAGYKVPCRRPFFSPIKIEAKGDWSNAAFFIVAGVIGEKPVTVTDIDINSKQGDKAIIDILCNAGARIDIEKNSVTAWPSTIIGTEINAAQVPDLVPVLSVAASVCVGKTRIYEAQRLRIKESDRLAAICDMLTNFGANCVETEDGLIIEGSGSLQGLSDDIVKVCSHNDHRIAMSAAVAATVCQKEVEISGAEAVNKSYPLFWQDYRKLATIKEDI